ncbi:uncharacterized protein PHACADRAFT_209866 [Phanerochaete carnosa HHB-10118-sp]|uniref:DUF7082 domain-containing protein n=1 Tax=Phanerochaete carnosa (strain HHB-10118-sp) TaxID=650164 RepID=K5W520_PHACS|nr:uncharacterized protein PHACADRAFT_209866 [Phanerochaete carnosa HHB-10118-sp]EKM54039.1 hypothetical protein PHACADRAFT_209866 [Phanerochaete carnosa HHB-10118-sp]
MSSPRPMAQSSYFPSPHPDGLGARPIDIMPDPATHLSDLEEHANDGASVSNCIVSPRGLFRVYRFHSLQGHGGVPISIPVNFTFRPSETTYLRIVVGRKALNTTVRQMSKAGVWELEAVVPRMENDCPEPTPVTITAQALTGMNGVLDAVTVGTYTYLPCEPSRDCLPRYRLTASPATCAALSLNGLPDRYSMESSRQHLAPAALHRAQSCPTTGLAARPRSSSPGGGVHALLPSSRQRSSASRASSSRHRAKTIASVRQSRKQTLMRTRRFGPGEESPESHRAVLEILTPLETMCAGWAEDELRIGRRLVRFRRAQEGHRLKLSCEGIRQDEYVEGDSVISCIYRRDTDSCYVTSVDIISLLEGIVGEGFEIEEKNRIRRNLEGFRPKTVSKNRAGSESFFQQIMDFPAPKPRNIEKDVKVFEWNVLPQALEKIISKYSLYYTTNDTGDAGLSASPSPEFVQHPGSPRGLPRFPSPSSSDIPPEAGEDAYYLADAFAESGSPELSYGSRSLLPASLAAYPVDSPATGSYSSLIETASLSGLSSGHSDSSRSSYGTVYRLVPPQAPFSDMTMPPGHLFHAADFHSIESSRMRSSPVPYF